MIHLKVSSANSPIKVATNVEKLKQSQSSQQHQKLLNGKQLQNIYNQLEKGQMDNSEEFQPPSISCERDQNYIHPKRYQNYPLGEKTGKWSQEQNTKYIVYIQYHREKMKSKQRRRASKLYKQMSKFIKSRNALQCRSHHQKLQDRFQYPNKIISNYKQHNDLVLYHQIKQQLQQFQNNSQAVTHNLKLQQSEQQFAIQTQPADMNTQYLHLTNNLYIVPINSFNCYDQNLYVNTQAYFPYTNIEDYGYNMQQFNSYCCMFRQ